MVEFMEKVIGARRASWRIISSIDQKEESRGNEGHVSTICEYRSKIESELSSICDGILKLLDSKLIGSASSGDSKCKKCNASMPPALGTKRLASEDPVQDWDNKRLNAGQQAYPPTGQIASSSYLTPFPMASSASNQTAGLFQLYPDGMAPAVQHSQLNLQLPQIMALPTLHGKGVL